MKKTAAINDLLKVMAKLRSPKGCPWDREQDHQTLRRHAVEEVYELIDAIEARDDHEMAEELGDLLLQVVFHCQLARERGAFDFEKVTRHLVEKLIRRHPHVFGTTKVKDVDEVWANWEKIKHAEKQGTHLERKSAFDGIPKHLPALLRAEKLIKKANKAGVLADGHKAGGARRKVAKNTLAKELFALAAQAQAQGLSAEEILAGKVKKQEREWRHLEQAEMSKNRH
jgi:tetrapyrrole methylase family protein/MazG family protein